MANIIPTVGIVAVRDGKILLVRHEEGGGHVVGTYGLPAGRLEEGEAEQEAAAREFEEETGLVSKIEDFKGFEDNYFIADVPRKDGSIVKMGWRVFKISNFTGQLKPSSDTTPIWFTHEQIEQFESDRILAPNVLNAINAALK